MFKPNFVVALRGVHTGTSFLHHHGVHDVREPAGLSARVQPAGGERGGAAVHGHSDLLSHGVPGEEKLHSQVGRALSTPESQDLFSDYPGADFRCSPRPTFNTLLCCVLILCIDLSVG